MVDGNYTAEAINWVECTVDDFKGAEDRFDELHQGVEYSLWCPEDTSKLTLKNNPLVDANNNNAIFLEFSTCTWDPELCITDEVLLQQWYSTFYIEVHQKR